MKKLILMVLMTSLEAFAVLSAAPEKPIDLTAIIKKTDAQSVLGEAVKDAQSRNGDGADGYYSRCNYYSENPGKSLILRVRQSAPGQIEPQKELEMLGAGNGKIKALSGVGEKAALLSEGGAARSLMLYVTKGKAFVTVGIGGMGDEKVAIEKAKTIARKILAQL